MDTIESMEKILMLTSRKDVVIMCKRNDDIHDMMFITRNLCRMIEEKEKRRIVKNMKDNTIIMDSRYRIIFGISYPKNTSHEKCFVMSSNKYKRILEREIFQRI